jgi:hypothetical protein
VAEKEDEGDEDEGAEDGGEDGGVGFWCVVCAAAGRGGCSLGGYYGGR